MAYANGRLPASLLTTVESKTRLLKSDAPVYFAFRMYAADRGRWLSIANAGKGGGGGYRTYAMQADMRRGSLGNIALAEKYDLNPRSSVALASAGRSSHGWADHARIDLVGTDLDWILQHASKFGARREFGSSDPNHFVIDQTTASTWRHTVGKTAASVNGLPGAQPSNFYRRLQLLAQLGGYRGPTDGKLGENSENGLRSELTAALGDFGKSRTGLLIALQRWAGVPGAKVTQTDDYRKMGLANTRAIGSKLNRL